MNDQSPMSVEEIRKAVEKTTRLGAVLTALGIILFAYAYVKLSGGIWQIPICILGALMTLFGIFLILLIQLGTRIERAQRNYFLYDKKTKQDRSPDSLTVPFIREKIAAYMASFRYHGKLYLSDLFSENMLTGDCFKVLFCYELLCQAAEDRNKAETLLSYGEECATVFLLYLSQSEDHELAHKVAADISNYRSDDRSAEDFFRYISQQKQTIEKKMHQYTLDNIEKF